MFHFYRVSNQVRAVLLKRDFNAVDKMVSGFQQRHALDLNGEPEIYAMYEGLRFPDPCGETAGDEKKWSAHAEALAQWRAASPASQPALLAAASFELASAWHARGTGLATTLTNNQLTGMREHAEQARRIIYAWPLAARANERWYVLALQIAFAQGMDAERFDQLFDEAVKRFPNSYAIYYAKTNYLSPKWFGSVKQQRKFIEQTASRRSSTSPDLYARLVWQATDWNPFTAGLADWPRTKASVDALLKKYPNVLWANRYANLACMANDLPVLRARLVQLGGDLNPHAWEGGAPTMEACKGAAEGKKCFTRADTGATFCE